MTSTTTYSNLGKMSDKKYTSIRLKDMTEVFQDYKKSGILLCVSFCDWKCCKEANIPESVCQNNKIASQEIHEIEFKDLIKVVKNSYTDSVIFAGLEPLLQIDEVVSCIEALRDSGVTKDILIYTGYYLEEIDSRTIEKLKTLKVILKCGRYIPDRPSKYDEVLGVTLVSDNQYGVKLY